MDVAAKTAKRGSEREQKARAAFRRHGGILRMADAVRAGIHRRTLYAMRDAGEVETLARGLYRLADAAPLGTPRPRHRRGQVPRGRDLPHLRAGVPRDDHADAARGLDRRAAQTAGRRGSTTRRSVSSGSARRPYEAGIETARLDGVKVQIYTRRRRSPTASSTATRSVSTPCWKRFGSTRPRDGRWRCDSCGMPPMCRVTKIATAVPGGTAVSRESAGLRPPAADQYGDGRPSGRSKKCSSTSRWSGSCTGCRKSRHAGHVCPQGGVDVHGVGRTASRPTRDIDLLARMDNAVEAVVAVVREVCGQAVEPDGLVFDGRREG